MASIRLKAKLKYHGQTIHWITVQGADFATHTFSGAWTDCGEQVTSTIWVAREDRAVNCEACLGAPDGPDTLASVERFLVDARTAVPA